MKVCLNGFPMLIKVVSREIFFGGVKFGNSPPNLVLDLILIGIIEITFTKNKLHKVMALNGKVVLL